MKLLCLLVLLLNVRMSLAMKGCGEPADTVFIIDSSRSIWFKYFIQMLEFINNVVAKFKVGPKSTRIGALSFSTGVREDFGLDIFKTKDEVVRAIALIDQMNGGDTETDAALKYVREKMFVKARPDVPKIAIVITDGRSSNTSLTQQEAAKSREAGIQIFAIGIGHDVDEKELESIASLPADDFVHTVTGFSNLDSIRELLVLSTCNVTTPAPTTPSTTTAAATTTTTTTTTTTPTTTTTTPTTTKQTTTTTPTTTVPTTTPTTTTTTTTTTTPTTTTTIQPETTTWPESFGILGDEAVKKACDGKPADVIFVLDISSSIYIDDFKVQLKFVSDVVEIFDVGPDTTQVAVASFSDNASVEFHLNDFKEKAAVKKHIMGVHYTGGKTYTNKALGLVTQDIMTYRHGFRKSVAHIVIVITDGMSAEPEVTSKVAEKLKKKGAYVFAIGVSNSTDLQELQDIASSPSSEFVYEVNGYDALKKLKNILAMKTCNVTEPMPQGDQPNQCVSRKPADLMYVTDFSGAGGFDVQRSIEMVKTTSETLDVGKDRVRIGYISNECPDVPTNIALDKYHYSDEFASALGLPKTISLASMLKKARLTLTGKKGGLSGSRDGVHKVAVVIVNGPIDDLKEATRQVLRASHKHVNFVFVKAGRRAELKQLEQLTDRPVLDFESVTFKRDLSKRICTAVSG